MRTLAVLSLAFGVAALTLALAGRFGEPTALIAALCGADGRAAWTFDAWVVVPLSTAASLYVVGFHRLWRKAGTGRGTLRARAIAYGCGWLALAGALVSPLHRWGEGLFAAHMIEHELVMAVAAPLLVLARPGAAFLWAFRPMARRRIGNGIAAPSTKAAWRVLTAPAVATVLHGLAIWAWHAPSLFDFAVANVALHRIQHLLFLATALLFWWAVFRRSPGAATGNLVLTMLHTSVLGALLALAPRVLYPGQTAGAAAWGLTPLEDQQLAGLLMWVPAGTVYAAAALWFASRWIRRFGAGWRNRDAVAQA